MMRKLVEIAVTYLVPVEVDSTVSDLEIAVTMKMTDFEKDEYYLGSTVTEIIEVKEEEYPNVFQDFAKELQKK